MNSGFIGKIEKAKRYAEEKGRIRFESFQVHFEGENGPHEVSLNKNRWQCTCDFFASREVCSHTMALERVLDGMLPQEAQGQEKVQRSV